MQPNSVPKQGFGFFVEDMDDETLLYRLGAHKAIHLNQVAAVIWKLCDGERTVEQIVDLMRREYPGREAEIETDVNSALDALAAEGAILDTASLPKGEVS